MACEEIQETLARIDELIMRDYDDKFKSAAAEGLKWYPWVGKKYRDTRVLVLGMGTDDRDGEWRECAENNPEAMRALALHGERGEDGLAFSNSANDKSYKSLTTMFLKGANLEYKNPSVYALWSSIAFHNFPQFIVSEGESWFSSKHRKASEQSKCALDKIVDIIKPNLILAWTTTLWNLGLTESEYETRGKKINGAYPRISTTNTPIVGIKHPSWYFSAEQWITFLRNDSVSKDPIDALLQHLQEQPVN